MTYFEPYEGGKFTRVFFVHAFRILSAYDYDNSISVEENEAIVNDIIKNAFIYDNISIYPYVEVSK